MLAFPPIVKPALFFTLLALMSGIPADAQTTEALPFVIESWQVPDGLPQNSVMAITQAQDGYLWVATRGGLAKFDGYQFTTYGMADGLGAVDVVDLLDDGEGGLWIGTLGGGVSHMSEGKIRTWTTDDGLLHNYAMLLAASEDGGVWVGGPLGLQHLDKSGTLTTADPADGFPSNRITELESRPGKGLWIATESDDLFHVQNGRCQQVKGPSDTEGINVMGLYLDTKGDLWVSIGNGKILRRHGEEWSELNMSNGLPLSFVYCMVEDAEGRLWAGTDEEGLFVLQDGHFHPVESTNRRSNSAVRSLSVSRDGLVWMGSQSGGLSRLNAPKVTSFSVGEPGNLGQVGSIAEDKSGTFWVAAYGPGLYRGKLDSLTDVKDTAYPLLTTLCASDGTIYSGGYQKLLKVNPESKDVTTITTDIFCTALAEGNDASLWTGTRTGELKRFVADKEIPVENGQFSSAISCIEPGHDGALWIATRGSGLFQWDAGVVTHWGKSEGLPSNIVGSLHEDEDHTLWIGTSGGGLAWMHHGVIFSVNETHGLGTNVILQVLEDSDSNIWLGTYQGILRVQKSELFAVAEGDAESVHPLLLNESDGMNVPECTGGYSPAGLRSKSGKLYFSTISGIVEVDPQSFNTPSVPPPARIEEFLADGAAIPISGSPITLPPQPQEVEIHFTAFNYAKPERLRFRYRLLELDSKWLDAGQQRVARFSQLTPGKYTFQAGAANADGYWSEPNATIEFEVLPAYWQTAWFRILMGILLVGSGGSLAAWWSRSHIQRARTREKLAQAEAEAQQHRGEVARLTRLAILGELSASLAHELNQPLAAILSNAQAARRFLDRGTAEPGEIRDILNDIVEDDQRASAVIQKVRTLLNKGEHQPRPLDLNALILSVVKLMDADLKSRGVSVKTELAANIPKIQGDRTQLQQVMINLLINACDAMSHLEKEKRLILIQSSYSKVVGAQVFLSDNGDGIPAEDAEKIFEAYYTTKDEGLGLGLSLSRSILFAHGGRLWAKNAERGGAVFGFNLQEWKDRLQ